MMFQSILVAAALLASAPVAAAIDDHEDIAHAPAPAPGVTAVDGLSATTVYAGRNLKKDKHCKKFKEDKLTEDKAPKHEKSKTKKKSKASKKTKEKEAKLTEEKVAKSKSKKHKEKECEEWGYADNRASLQTECENLMEEDKPVEVLVVAYNYTIEMDVGESISSTIRDMEDEIHIAIVSDQLRCDDPVIRRRLGGIRHSRKLFFNKEDDEQLKIVGTDPSPEDTKSKTNFCLIGVDNCVSVNGYVTLLLEGEVTDELEAAEERQATVSLTRDSIKKTFRSSDKKAYLVQKFAEARHETGFQSAQEAEESSFSPGGALAGVLAAGLIVAGAAFVWKKKQKGATGGSREVHAQAEAIPVADAKVLKDDKKKDSVPMATVVEEMPVVQTDDDKKKLNFNFGKPAVPH